jgi:aminopeptidase N
MLDLRWYFLIALTDVARTRKAELDAEACNDNTTTGNLSLRKLVLAAMPNNEAKATHLIRRLDAEVATSVRTALVAGFQRPIQRTPLEPFVNLYFDNLISVWGVTFI